MGDANDSDMAGMNRRSTNNLITNTIGAISLNNMPALASGSINANNNFIQNV